MVTVSGGVTYTWGPNQSNSTGFLANPAGPGPMVIGVDGTDVYGCLGSGATTISVEECVGVTEHANDPTELVAFPNPSAEGFNIRAAEDLDIEVININGQKVWDSAKLNAYETLTISNLAPGVYIVRARNNVSVAQTRVVVTD